MKVFLTQWLDEKAVDHLKTVADVVCPKMGEPLTRQEFLDGIKDADAVVLTWHTDHMDKEAFEVAKKLKVVSRRGVGYDNIDIKEATRRGVRVTYVPVHTPTIADLTFGLIICAGRRIHVADNFVRSGQWTAGGTWVAHKFMGYDIHHKRLGIIGLGRIGFEVAKRGKGFDMEVIYNDVMRKPELEKKIGIRYASLDELIETSDYISVNCALNDTTRGLINVDKINRMKTGAIVVVSARGGIVDEMAVYEALVSGKLGGAGFDVFEEEPIRPDHPLLKLENVVFTPHLGTSVADMRVKMEMTVAEDVVRVLKGEAPMFALN